jgi:hypothetical protein
MGMRRTRAELGALGSDLIEAILPPRTQQKVHTHGG